MSEFNNDFRPVTYETVHDIPPEAGVVLSGLERLGKLRPFAIQHFNTPTVPPVLRLLAENGVTSQSIGLFELPGIQPTPQPADAPYSSNGIGASFRYYKAIKNGYQEKLFRDIVFIPGEPSIGYGLLQDPSHDGEAPTWYFSGVQVGTSQLYNGHLVHFRTIANPVKKNFSGAKIEGLFDSPATNAAFRNLMRIKEIPK